MKINQRVNTEIIITRRKNLIVIMNNDRHLVYISQTRRYRPISSSAADWYNGAQTT